jgi:putative ABC transport system permease protein
MSLAWGKEQPLVVLVAIVAISPCIAVVVGAVAGLCPAIRAARLSPTQALRAA